MDLIGMVSFIGSRLDGRKPNQGRGKPAKKGDEKKTSNSAGSIAPEVRLGGKIDTTA